VGLVTGTGGEPALASASAAGLAAVIVEGDSKKAGLPLLPAAERSKVPWNSPSPVLVVKDNIWPATPRPVGRGDALAGPTASPWIDSNGWFLRLAQVRAPQKLCWLLFDPPGPPDIVLTETYVRAVADAGAFGGRWVVSLDEDVRSGLIRKAPSAVESWRALSAALAFFERHRDWSRYGPLGVIGVISDFSGDNETLAEETLNLLCRRNLPYRILEKSTAEATRLESFRALVAVDEQLPPPGLRQRLLAFAQAGGVLLASESWKGEGGTPTGEEHPRLDIRRLGKGRVAVSKTDSPDPYMVARDVHVLLGRAYDLTRFYNIEAFISNYCAPPDGSGAVLHMTDFSRRREEDRVTAWFRKMYRSARLWRIGTAEPVQATLFSENGGMDVQVPAMGTYVALELS
jgi:hypothetical protein